MKTLGLIVMMSIPVLYITAQEPAGVNGDTVNKVISKAELKKIELQNEFNSTSKLISDKNFILEANFLSNLYRNRTWVNSSLNFIKVDSTHAVIQVGNNNGIGYNGVGGVTAEGNITRWKLTINEKKKCFYLSMGVITAIGIYDIDMNINADGNATANLSGLRHGRLTYEGKLVPSEEARVYQGSTTY